MDSLDNNGAGTKMNEPLDYDVNGNNLNSKDERLWATLAHLGIVAGLIIPFGSVLGPLIIWLVFKDRSSYVDYHAKEALNFQLTMLIGFVACIILMFIIIGIPLLIALAIVDLVMSIKAAMAADKGEHYKYPYSLRLIK